jgi:Na+/phosphate symporter
MDYISIGLLVAVLGVVVSTLSLVVNLTRSVSDLTRSIGDLRERITRVEDGIERLTTSNTRRIASTATNPFTEAERRRLLELVDKDDLTLEEAEELHNLARKFYREYIEKTPDAYKVLLYAAAKHGEVLRKHSKQQPSQPST